MHRGRVLVAFALTLAVALGLRGSTDLEERRQQLPSPIDPQQVRDQETMTWADYVPIPGRNWADPSLVPSQRTFRVALVAIDFTDQPFVITRPKGSDPFGNPQIDPVPRERVAQFYADFFNTPSALNHGQTINGYWMEQSRGQIGIGRIDAYGPYRMPRNLFEYGLNEYGQEDAVPSGYSADGRMEPDVDALWAADAGANIKDEYDFVLRIYAGYDETSVWQEFGEMKFRTRDDVTAEFGNPDTTKPRWVTTRYVPWTSWLAGAQQWGLSSVRQGESSGTITHEIAHLAFRIGDNNNNPYIQPYRRVASGPWDIMDRGSFNGPGGPHRRWVVPPTEGAAMPAGLMLRSRIRLEFVPESEVLRLNRNGLAQTGLAVARVTARAVQPPPGALTGIAVHLDGEEPVDRTPPDDMNQNPLSAGRPSYDYYSVEVVQRIGYDSFTPDNGVLLSKNKTNPDRGGSCGASYNCFTWVIDAHPQDMNMVDYVRPGGERVMRTIADYRQLNDALFHAGLNSGSAFEWQDPHNRLHFYIIDLERAADGIRSYTLGVRSLDGAGPHRRGVSLSAPSTGPGADGFATFTLSNTGVAAQIPAGTHPMDARAYTRADIYRMSVATEGQGWTATLLNGLATAPFGGSQPVRVHLGRTADAAPAAQISLTATSESDPSQTATVTWMVRR
jgi:M6 family metalloprotease-like protein